MSQKDLYYKSKGGHIKSVPLHKNTTRINLDYRPIDSIDLEPLRECPLLKELSLKSCIINIIDLSPLEMCKNITRIDLSGNRLQTIDLIPLSNLKYLKYLNLGSNGIRDLNLVPLTGLTYLESLTLRGNGFQELDVTPLALCTNLRYLSYSPDVMIIADSLLQHYGPNLVRSKIEVFKDSVAAASKVVDALVNVGDCRELQKILLKMLQNPTRIMEKQFHILQVLGMVEFVGIDTSLYDMIDSAPANDGLDEFVNHIYNSIVDQIDLQVANNGFMAFFDIEKMKQTHAAHLIPKILQRRQLEFEEVCIHQDQDDIIDLTPLWMTSFGYNILSALEMGLSIEAKEFDKIEQALREVNLKVCISMDSERESVFLSDELKDFVLSVPI